MHTEKDPPLPNPGRREVISLLRQTSAEFTTNSERLRIRGIGIGVPGHINSEARFGLNYPFIENGKNVDLPEELALTPEFFR